jgi:hypothetical protein
MPNISSSKMANEANPDNVLVVKNVVTPGRLIGLPHVGLDGNLEVLNIVIHGCME